MEQMKIGCEQREFFYITYELQIFIYGDAFEQSECFVCMYSWHFSIYIITSRPLLESMDGWMENRFGIGEIYRITRMVNIVFNEIQNKLNGKCVYWLRPMSPVPPGNGLILNVIRIFIAYARIQVYDRV